MEARATSLNRFKSQGGASARNQRAGPQSGSTRLGAALGLFLSVPKACDQVTKSSFACTKVAPCRMQGGTAPVLDALTSRGGFACYMLHVYTNWLVSDPKPIIDHRPRQPRVPAFLHRGKHWAALCSSLVWRVTGGPVTVKLEAGRLKLEARFGRASDPTL